VPVVMPRDQTGLFCAGLLTPHVLKLHHPHGSLPYVQVKQQHNK